MVIRDAIIIPIIVKILLNIQSGFHDGSAVLMN
jgi:hypothetical protein